jgi:hypothetical protein
MTETSPSDSAPITSISPGHIFHRMSLPVLLFCAVFATALGVSHIAILPALTSVEVGGIVRDAAGLQEYADTLKAKLAVLQEDRDEQILPLDGTPYRALVDGKIGAPSTMELLETFRAFARDILPEHPESIVITTASFDASAHAFSMTGDVRGVGPGSMTVLAQFTEMLRDDPRVDSLIAPTFKRLEDPKIGPHSPFTIVLTLR